MPIVVLIVYKCRGIKELEKVFAKFFMDLHGAFNNDVWISSEKT